MKNNYLPLISAALIGTSTILPEKLKGQEVNRPPEIQFYFFLRDIKGMPVKRELRPDHKYTLEIWAGKPVNETQTFGIEGKLDITPSNAVEVTSHVSPEEYTFYTSQGITNDFFYCDSMIESFKRGGHVSNSFNNGEFKREFPVLSQYGLKDESLGYGLVSRHNIQIAHTDKLQKINISAQFSSYAFDGVESKKERVLVFPEDLAIVPEPRPIESLLIIDKFGYGLKRIYATATAEGTKRILQYADSPNGPWRKVEAGRNEDGSLVHIDEGIGVKSRFFRTVPE